MESFQILVVDDDADILRILRDNLELDGYGVRTAVSGREALKHFEECPPGLVVLDLSLPDLDGIRVCRTMREKSDVPIIMLTARDRVADKVLGLESGADDYIAKPFDYLELAARIRACLRRGRPRSRSGEILRMGSLRIDTARNVVWRDDVKVNLTQREFTLLLLLARNVGRVLSRTEIRQALWPEGDLYKDSRVIDVHVQHLRSKLEDNPADPVLIKTVQGVGYLFHPGHD